MSTTLTIIAFADDVRCLNANLADSKLARIAPQYGLVGTIGLPVTAKPVAPRTNLHAHEATFSTEGHAKLAEAARTNEDAVRLRLSVGETFGLLLAYWRDIYGSGCVGMTEKPHEPQFCKLALYKMHLATAAGDEREAKRLTGIHKAMKAEFEKERQADRISNNLIRCTLEGRTRR